MDTQNIKQRFGIIGNSPLLNRAIDIASQVAPTDMSVLITGESGSGKEVFSHIIHQMSARKHGAFIAVNCGAIPEGTIDQNYLAMRKVLLPEHMKHVKDISKLQMEAQYF